jgi:hypothetical protein
MRWEYAWKRKYNEEKKMDFLTYLAGHGGYKDVLVWLKRQGCALGSEVGYGAVRGGHPEVLKRCTTGSNRCWNDFHRSLLLTHTLNEYPHEDAAVSASLSYFLLSALL